MILKSYDRKENLFIPNIFTTSQIISEQRCGVFFGKIKTPQFCSEIIWPLPYKWIDVSRCTSLKKRKKKEMLMQLHRDFGSILKKLSGFVEIKSINLLKESLSHLNSGQNDLMCLRRDGELDIIQHQNHP